MKLIRFFDLKKKKKKKGNLLQICFSRALRFTFAIFTGNHC